MRILSAHRGNDTGGTGWRLSEAFKAASQQGETWEFRSACNPTSVLPYLQYPEDVPWSEQELIQQLFAEADVFHARNDWSTFERLGGGKSSVIHYHGTNFRTLWATRLRQQKEHAAIGLVSTLDLYLIRPQELEWLPSPYDLDWLNGLRAAA